MLRPGRGCGRRRRCSPRVARKTQLRPFGARSSSREQLRASPFGGSVADGAPVQTLSSLEIPNARRKRASSTKANEPKSKPTAKPKAKASTKPKRVGWSFARVPAAARYRLPAPPWLGDWKPIAFHVLGQINAGYLKSDAGQVLERIGTPNRAVLAPSETTLEVCFALHLWCEAQNIHPATWIAFCFRYRAKAKSGKAPPPRLEDFFAENTEALPTFREWGADETSGHTANTALHAALRPVLPLALLPEPYPAAEQGKHEWLSRGRAQLCRASWHLIGGFHPRSAHCAVCPERIPCYQETLDRLARGVAL